MHDDDAARHGELTAGALAGELTEAERRELAALEAAHPALAAERTELEALVRRLDGFGAWEEPAPSPELEAGIAAIGRPTGADDAPEPAPRSLRPVSRGVDGRSTSTHRASPAPVSAPPHPAPIPLRPRRRIAALAAGAAACVAIGVGIGATAFGERSAPLADGAPGELGALEAVDFVGAPTGLDVEGALVAHTWGTETVLTIDGLPTGEAFTVVVLGEDGTEHEAGAMLGSDATIDCRLNAAVLREDVAAVEIRSASGDEVAHAEVVDV